MSTTTATVYDLDDCVDGSRSILVSDEEAREYLHAAVEWLDAVRVDAGGWVYLAHEVNRWYMLDQDELIDAGASLEHARGDWYSLWCATTGRQVMWCEEHERVGPCSAAHETRDYHPTSGRD